MDREPVSLGPLKEQVNWAQQQERLLIDFMAIAQNHVGREQMKRYCEQFDQLHTAIVQALSAPIASCNPPRPKPPYEVK